MRAARLYGMRDLRVEDLADPAPGPGEALIRIEACGVCPSDIRSYTGARGERGAFAAAHAGARVGRGGARGAPG